MERIGWAVAAIVLGLAALAADKPADKPADKATDKATDKAADKPAEAPPVNTGAVAKAIRQYGASRSLIRKSHDTLVQKEKAQEDAHNTLAEVLARWRVVVSFQVANVAWNEVRGTAELRLSAGTIGLPTQSGTFDVTRLRLPISREEALKVKKGDSLTVTGSIVVLPPTFRKEVEEAIRALGAVPFCTLVYGRFAERPTYGDELDFHDCGIRPGFVVEIGGVRRVLDSM